MDPELIRLIEENGLTLHGDIELFAHLVAAYVRESEFKPDWNNYQQGLVDGGEVAKCSECGKSAAEGWALYCVRCCEESIVQTAVSEERKACAAICDEEAKWSSSVADRNGAGAAVECGYKIRARGGK